MLLKFLRYDFTGYVIYEWAIILINSMLISKVSIA